MTEVESRLEGGGRWLKILIDRPKGNVLTGAVMKSLDACLQEHAERPELCFVTIRGAGKHFSFGASVEEHQKTRVADMLGTFHALIRRIAAYPVPVAALVSGRCLGGAFEVALACHLVLADATAVFACPEIKLGVFPPVLAALGPQRLGAALSERLLLTGGELDAESARRAEFVSRLAPAGADLDEVAAELFDTDFAKTSSFALRQAVRASREGSGFLAAADAGIRRAEELYLSSLVPSHDGNEGIAAFLGKREPQWTHQ